MADRVPRNGEKRKSAEFICALCIKTRHKGCAKLIKCKFELNFYRYFIEMIAKIFIIRL